MSYDIRFRYLDPFTLGTYTKKTYRKPGEQLFPNRWPLSNPKLFKNMKMHISANSTKIQHQDIKQ